MLHTSKIAIIFLIQLVFICKNYAQVPNSQNFSKLSYIELDTLFESLNAKEKYKDLLPYAQAALQKAEKEYGKMDTLTAKWLYNLGYAYDYGMEDADKALEFYKKAAAIQKAKMPASITYANTLLAIGEVYSYLLNQYKEAEPFYLQALDIQEKILGHQHPDYETSLSKLANLYNNIMDYPKSESFYLRLITVQKKSWGEQHPNYAQSLNSLASLYSNTGNDSKAESLYLQAAAIRKKALGDQHLDYAQSLNNLANLYKVAGNYAKAEPCALQSLAIVKKNLGDTHTYYAISLNNLADIYLGMKKYAKAESLYFDIISIYKKNLGAEDVSYGQALLSLATLYREIGNYAKSEPLLLQANSIYKKALGELHPKYAFSLDQLAFLYQEMGSYAKAEALCLQAITIYKKMKGENPSDYSNSLITLAYLYVQMGNYTKAEPFYLQALEIQKKAFGEQDPYYANTLTHLANLYKTMTNYTKAEPLYLQAMEIFRKSVGEQDAEYANILNHVANLYKIMGNYSKAEVLYLQSLEIWKTVLGELHPDYANGLNHLANLYEFTKDYTKSEPLYLQALIIRKKVLGEFHPQYASSLDHLANLYKNMGNYAKSESLYLQTIALQKKILGELHPDYAASLNCLAGLYENMQKLDSAFHYCCLGIFANAPTMNRNFYLREPSVSDWGSLDTFSYTSNLQINASIKTLSSIFQKQYDQTKDPTKLDHLYLLSQAAIRLNERFRNEFMEGDKLRILAENNGFVLTAIKTGIALHKADYEATTFGFAEMNKGVLLLESEKTANAQEFGELPDEVAEKEKSLYKKQSSLTAKLLEKRPETEKDSLRRDLNSINQEIDAFNKMLKNKFPKYAASKYSYKTATAKEIQALLDDKTALLEYVIGDSVVYIFYVDKNKVVLTPKYIKSKELADKIKDFHSVLSNYKLAIKEPAISYQKYTANAFWFYNNLVQPALSNAKGISKLLIVSDGELGHLPFEAFLTKSAPQKETDYHQLRYLSNDYKISYNYSATIWKSIKERTKNSNNQQILAIASNYNIKIDSSKTHWRLPSEQRLRTSLKPLPAAQKEIKILEESFNGFFAFDKDASEKNFKAKAGDYAIIHLAMHGLLDNKAPILSSLAFTEDGDSLENNFLHAYEISKMKLNADLVVLSACETGYGRFDKGNGIASLAQAFSYAGAPAMIVSLWQVNDYATSVIMKNLYQNLADGMEKDEALQQAKLKYMKEAKGVLAHPAFWSAFIMMGDTDAIVVEKRRAFSVLWAIGIGLAVLGIGAFARSRKKRIK